MRISLLRLALIALGTISCGGGQPQIAEKNRVFYAFDSPSPALAKEFETHYEPLDLAAAKGAPTDYLGVAVLDGKVRLSRPLDWKLRSATNEAGKRSITYVSPHEYMFAIYEWPDPPAAPWSDVITRYEKATTDAHAEIIESRVPIATFNGQGRAFVVRRKVPAAKMPFENVSLEMLVRTENRIVLVQIVHQGDSIAPLAKELLRVIETLELDS